MSENMEINETSEVRNSTESQNVEGQHLADATTTPEAHVEQTQSYQEAEAVETVLTELVDAAIENTAPAVAGDEVKVTPSTIPDELPESSGERVTQKRQNVAEQEQESQTSPEQPLREAEFEKPILSGDLGLGEPGGRVEGSWNGSSGSGEDEFGNLKPGGVKGDLFGDPFQIPEATLGKEDFSKTTLNDGLMGGDPTGGMVDPYARMGLQDDMFSSKGQSDGSPNPLVAGNAPGHISGATAEGGQGKGTSSPTTNTAQGKGKGKSGSTTTTQSFNPAQTPPKSPTAADVKKSIKEAKNTGLPQGTVMPSVKVSVGSLLNKIINSKGSSEGPIMKNVECGDPNLGGDSGQIDIAHVDYVNESYDQSHISNITPGQAGDNITDGAIAPEHAKEVKDVLEKKKTAMGSLSNGLKVNPEEVTDPASLEGQAGKQAMEGKEKG